MCACVLHFIINDDLITVFFSRVTCLDWFESYKVWKTILTNCTDICMITLKVHFLQDFFFQQRCDDSQSDSFWVLLICGKESLSTLEWLTVFFFFFSFSFWIFQWFKTAQFKEPLTTLPCSRGQHTNLWCTRENKT